MTCPLCAKEHLTAWLHEDEICWACYCASHQDKVVIVLNRHDPVPTIEEINHMESIARKLLPNATWRGPKSLPEHFHLHQE